MTREESKALWELEKVHLLRNHLEHQLIRYTKN